MRIILLMIFAISMTMLALHHDQWLSSKPIETHSTPGQMLFFEANWCGACKAMNPAVERLKSEGFDIRPMDFDSHRQEAIGCGVRALPTFILVRDGHEVQRATGAMSDE